MNAPASDLSAVRYRGMADFTAGVPALENPFPPGGVNFFLWQVGWGMAQCVDATLKGKARAELVEEAYRRGLAGKPGDTSPKIPKGLTSGNAETLNDLMQKGYRLGVTDAKKIDREKGKR